MDKVIAIVVFQMLTTCLCVTLMEYTLSNGTTCYQSEEAQNHSRCYVDPRITSMVNWTESNNGCQSINGTFSLVRSQIEFDTVAAIMRRTGIDDVWLPGFKEEGNWTWIRNGKDLIEANAYWGDVQSRVVSDCATTAAVSNWEWYWFPCDLTTGFICQREMDTNTGCPNENYFALEFNTSNGCFYLAEEELTFYEARETCVQYNMLLASVDSQEIYDKLVNLSALPYDFKQLYWIGLTRARWYWAIDDTTTEEILETFWASNAPSFLSPSCISMEFIGDNDYKWFNRDCSTSYYYLCEVDAPPPPENSNSSSSPPHTTDTVASSVIPESLSPFSPPDSTSMSVSMVTSSIMTDVNSSAINPSESTTVAIPMTSSSPQILQSSGTNNAQEPTSTITIDESSSIEVLPTSLAEMQPSMESPSFNVESSGETVRIPMTPSSQTLQLFGSSSAQEPTLTVPIDERSSTEVLPTSSAEMQPSTESPSFNVESSGERMTILMTPSSPQPLQPSGSSNAQEPRSTLEIEETPSTEVLSISSAEMLPSPSTESPSFSVESSGETLPDAPSSFQIPVTELDDSSMEYISVTPSPIASKTLVDTESLSSTPVFTPVLSLTTNRIETSKLTSSSSMTLSNNIPHSSQFTPSPTEPLTSPLRQVVTSTHQEKMTTSPSLIISSSIQDLISTSVPVDSVPEESRFGQISRPLTGLAIALVIVAGVIVIGTAIGAVIVKRRRARPTTALPQDERTNLTRRFASRRYSKAHDQKSQASTADLRSNEEGQRSPSDLGSLTSSQRSATRVRFQSNRYGPMGGITPTQHFPQTMHYSSWLVRAGYR